ncbi:hypothetical protein R75483_07874 [Paraburkholderia domus]|nr:hypothetical protein R75483_07874 [Paraburkholderia domus]
MALRRRYEPDRAVPMFLVVPAHQCAHPGTRGEQGIERLEGVSRPVLQSLEQRLGIRIVVAHARATQRRHDTQRLEGGEHRCAFHRAAVIRMQNHLIGLYHFACAKVPEDFAGQRAAFLGIDLPADNLATEYIQKQVQIKILSADRRRQIRDVPGIQLVRRVGANRTRFAASVGRPFAAPVGKLLLGLQYPVERRFGGDIALLVCQSRHDLAWRQMTEFGRVRDRQQLGAFVGRKLVARLMVP